MEQQQTNRIGFIDIAKGIGILLVVIGHLISEKSIPGKMIYSFHMPLFWFLSGCFLRSGGGRNFIVRKYNTLLVPCFAFTCICGLAEYYLLGNDKVFCNLSYELPGALWFLPNLFVSSVLFATIINIKHNWAKFLFAFVVIYLCQMRFNLHQFPYKLHYTPYALFFVAVGHFYRTYNAYPSIISKYARMLMFLGFSILFHILLYVVLPKCTHIECITILHILTAVCGIALIIIISKWIECYSNCSVLKYLGRNTLVIMSLHVLYMHMCLEFIKPHVANWLLYKSIEISVVLFLCVLSIEVINRQFRFILGKI